MNLKNATKEAKEIAKKYNFEFINMYHFLGKINVNRLLLNNKLSENLIEALLYSEEADTIDYTILFSTQNISEKFINRHIKKFNERFCIISISKSLSEKFIDKYYRQLDWRAISASQKLSVEFIEKYINYIHMPSICLFQELTEDFIRKYIQRIREEGYFTAITVSQVFSEKFIEEMETHIDETHCWEGIFSFQKLSDEFKKKYAHKVRPVKVFVNSDFKEEILTDKNEFIELDSIYFLDKTGKTYKVGEVAEDQSAIYLE